MSITAFLVFGIAGIVAATGKWPIALFCAAAFMLGGGFLGLLFGIPIGVTGAMQQQSQRQDSAATGNRANANASTASAPGVNTNQGAAGEASAANQAKDPSPGGDAANVNAGATGGARGAQQQPETSPPASGQQSVSPPAGAAVDAPQGAAGGAPPRNPRPAITGSQDQKTHPTTLLVEAAKTVGKVLAGAIAFSFKNIYDEFHKFAASLGQSIGEPTGNLAGGILVYFGAFGFVCGLLLPRYFLKQFTEDGQ